MFNLLDFQKKYINCPKDVDFNTIDLICNKLSYAKIIFIAYDDDIKKPIIKEELDKKDLFGILLIILKWNDEKRDLKILNTLLRSVEKFNISTENFLESLEEQKNKILCK